MKTKHFSITGLVQGVGYRAWLYKKAGMLGVSGWCKNNEDGSVEAVVTGDPEKVDALLMAVQQGPVGAQVEAVTLLADAPDEKGSFRIEY
ncbi:MULTISPECIES: acylphosphatase [Pseudovibrio]|jgi:acylphosphatase|uniref:acylphosphatase n=1 Tax=Pseudovibrio ascidiaceicola TaxID=285279 RepID=A0A1I4EUS1_9HYPH|nr:MULTISPECIES: acylphosphatase [Pseudovibrio]KZL05899.1 Acylphosphatase [Pseudovibrio sp. Ad26]SFL09448.1 acylphosphatase [Pseudovibrio ascidiaceicola]